MMVYESVSWYGPGGGAERRAEGRGVTGNGREIQQFRNGKVMCNDVSFAFSLGEV